MKYGVTTHRMFHPSHSVVGIPRKQYFSSQLRMFNPFQTIFGMVRFLICLGTWLCQNKWRAIKTFGVMIQNVGAFTRNTEFSLFPLRGKTVSATVPYFRPCFPVTVAAASISICVPQAVEKQHAADMCICQLVSNVAPHCIECASCLYAKSSSISGIQTLQRSEFHVSKLLCSSLSGIQTLQHAVFQVSKLNLAAV